MDAKVLATKKVDFAELITDLCVWARESDSVNYDDFIEELRRCAKVRNVSVEALITKAKRFESK